MKTMKTRRHTCKRLLSVLVALAMCIGMFQSVAFAGEIPEDGNAAEENGDMAVEFLVVNTDDADDAEDTEDAGTNETEDAEVPEDTENVEDTEDAEVPEDTENIEDTENAEDTEDAGDAEVPEDTENKVNTDDVETILPEEPGESEEPDDAETPDETEKPGETGSWDMKDTERPEQTPDVSVGVGPTDPLVTPSEPAEPNHPAEGKDWSIFYDKENDVYKLTFNIGEDAKGEQVIDMTYALELLNQYAQAGSAEPEPVAPTEPAPEMSEEDKAKQEAYDKALENLNFGYMVSMLEGWGAPGCTQGLDKEGIIALWTDGKTLPGFITNQIEIPEKPAAPTVDKESAAYQEYLKAFAEYEKELADYKLRQEADVLQPGDVRKFQIFLTSSSKDRKSVV